MEPQALALTDAYGYKILRAVILGMAGVSSRSVMPNLTEREQSKPGYTKFCLRFILNFIIVPFF
jgi:hypothetical protein